MKKLLTLAVAAATITGSASAAPFQFTAGDLVVSVSGNVDGSGPYTDNQASPIKIQQLTTSGTLAGSFILPQTSVTVGGVTQSAISAEYGSSSEGFLQLSGNGRYLTMMGYGINAATFNSGGAGVYGDPRLAQSTSLTRGTTFTPVSRVVALIGADGSVDTSTALYNVFNGNNPRSAYTVDGTSIYVSGQGQKGDTTQGVFVAQKGASSAIAITNATDTRDVMGVNGKLYVSYDSTQNSAVTNPSVLTFNGLPTSATAPSALPGIGPTITVNANTDNSVNHSRSGTFVYLSPEQYYFANSTTLYIADSGAPKSGNAEKAALGDGGLQKWTYSTITQSWSLAYTLSNGLHLVDNTATAGTTGLFGLTGSVSGDSVSLFATNYTVGDLDPSYLYEITDSLSATSLPTSEQFSTIYTPDAGTKVRGVSFAPSIAGTVPEPATWAMLLIGVGAAGGLARRRRRSGGMVAAAR